MRVLAAHVDMKGGSPRDADGWRRWTRLHAVQKARGKFPTEQVGMAPADASTRQRSDCKPVEPQEWQTGFGGLMLVFLGGSGRVGGSGQRCLVLADAAVSEAHT